MKILITGGNGNIAKMIKKNLSNEYEIVAPSRSDLNVLNLKEVETFLNGDVYDILIHTAISGGRRTKEDSGSVTHNNLLMLENILHFSEKFKMIINLDSGAIYDRSTDILNRKEDDLFTVPTDHYGFSKYLIYKRSLQYENIYNLRIFNIFHPNEECDRFIKSCFLSLKRNLPITIFEDKYFDFVYEDDFIKILKYYIDNFANQDKLDKTINVCYEEKYKLSDVAKIIMNVDDPSRIIVLDDKMQKNYSGNWEKLSSLNLQLMGLANGLISYGNKLNEKNILIDLNLYVYDYSCGGRTVQFELCRILRTLGVNAMIKSNQQIQNHICNAYYNNDFPIDDNCVVIYGETIEGNPLNAKNVVRWILGPVGVSSRYDIPNTWGKNDLVYYFNSEEKFETNQEKIGVTFKLLNSIYINPNIKNYNQRKSGTTCFTLRKCGIHKQPLNFIHFQGSYEIKHGHTQEQCVEIFNQCEYFISYDPLTFLSIMAALCGCISVVYPLQGLTKQQWIQTTVAGEYVKSKGIYNLYGIAYGSEQSELNYAFNTMHLVKEQWDDILKFCKETTIIPFINDIQNFEGLQNTVQNNYFST